MRLFVFRCIAFIAVFAALQALWSGARGSWLNALWIDRLTVPVAASAINALTPATHAQAVGGRIVAQGGGLNILNGCEGTEVFFLLAAALLVYPMRLGLRVAGLLYGLALVFALNQVRIIVLFYTFRGDRELFDLLHTSLAPLVMVMLTGLFFHSWVRRSEQRTAPAEPPAARSAAAASAQ